MFHSLSNRSSASAAISLIRRKTKLHDVIRQAEELLQCRFQRSRTSPIGVGLAASDYQTQYFNLLPDWFQSDSSLIASKIPALVGSGHPVLRLRKNIDPDAEEHTLTLLSNNIQWRAFIIMLVAKAFGTPCNSLFHVHRPYVDLIQAKQRTLSEIAEMMHFAFCLHRTIVEINRSKHDDDSAMEEKESSLHLGNKLVILLGDLLLSRTSKGLSSLKNAKVTELMSDAISDFSESEILRRKHLEFFKYTPTGNADIFKELADLKDNSKKLTQVPSFESWKSRVNLDTASLIGRACKSSILISQHDQGACQLAHDVGRVMGFVIQAYADLEIFIRDKGLKQPEVDLSTLPVIFHLNSDSIEGLYSPTDIYRTVQSSPIALIRTQDALNGLKDEALHLLSKLPQSTPAPQLLANFIFSLS